MSFANALTLLRLLLVVPFALGMARAELEAAWWALAALAVAIATDLLDGPAARRAGTESAAGGAFDHTTDFLFVAGGLFAGAARGVFPWLLPVLVCAAFAQYVFDSYFVYRRGQLFRSGLGRVNGILYFVPLLLDILLRLVAPAAQAARPVLSALAWLLVASTLVSMAMRLRAALR